MPSARDLITFDVSGVAFEHMRLGMALRVAHYIGLADPRLEIEVTPTGRRVRCSPEMARGLAETMRLHTRYELTPHDLIVEYQRAMTSIIAALTDEGSRSPDNN